MTTEMIAAAVLYNLAVLGFAWAWLRARADAKELLTELNRAANGLCHAAAGALHIIEGYVIDPGSSLFKSVDVIEKAARINAEAAVNAYNRHS